MFIDKSVIVVGDEELALRSVGELSTIASQVTMVVNNDKMLNTPLGQKLQRAVNVRIIKNREIVEVRGDDSARELVLKDKNGETDELMADGMFVEKALTPNVGMVRYLVELDPQGRIVVDSACRTSVPGLFAAGDVTNSYAEQVLIAVGEGAKAALSAYEYLLPML